MRLLVMVCGCLVALSSGLLSGLGCGGTGGNSGNGNNGPVQLPAPSCQASPSGGSHAVAEPQLLASLGDRYHEAWLGSPAVADLDGDGTAEILAAREGLLLGWHADGQSVFRAQVSGRIWSSPVVADLDTSRAGLEVAVAARGRIYAWDAAGTDLPGFPYQWRDEMRALAAGDIDGDGALELVAVTTSRLEQNDRRDILIAVEMNGATVSGFPPNTTGASGCDKSCYVTGGYDQNLAVGDVNGDDVVDILAPTDSAYISLHEGNGRAFDAAEIFQNRTKFLGIRMLHDYAEAQQGFAPVKESANQAHFTNSAPAIADIDGDGVAELVVVGSVQNAAQSDRERGVALWVLNSDGTRPADWITPFHASDFLAGLWDYDGTNVVAATNQVAVADLDPARSGFEMVFAGFDGRIHAVDSRAQELWSYTYTTDDRVLTGGVAIADLSGDGVPEIAFNTYSPDAGKGELVILDAGGSRRHAMTLPRRGAMSVPTIADANGDGQLDIAVNLKDGRDGEPQVLIFTVANSADNCLLWPTARANLRRDGYVPPG
ncbi:MAG: VCBS repeat-containing protein [Proteobacteria bacterium]|nr:VCBS repeat-containing protein [Pseudomonadota bacterium]